MGKIYLFCIPEKDLYIPSYEQRFMNWHTRIRNEWTNAGIIERISWIFGITYPMLGRAVDKVGSEIYYNYSISNLVLYGFFIIVIILNIRMRHSRTEIVKKKNVEIDSWAVLCEKLKYQLGQDNITRQKQRIEDRTLFYSRQDLRKESVPYQMDAYLDPTTPEDALYNEADIMLMRHSEDK
jgi:hypothetical protein